MDSSNDSFVWSNASDDDSDSLKNNVKDDSDSGRSNIKKILNNETLQSDSSSKEFNLKKIKKEKSHCEAAKQDCNMIKVEPESDFEKKSSSKKKKSKHKDSHKFEPTYDNDESFLNLKVKEEQESFYKHLNKTIIDNESSIMCESNDTHTDSHTEYSESQSSKKKKKKTKIEDIIECNNKVSTAEHDINSLSYSKHKKKKQETHEGKNESESSNFIIEEKFSAEETVVQQPQEKLKKTKKNLSTSKLNIVSKEFVENSDSEHDFNQESEFAKSMQSNNSIGSAKQYKITDRIQFEDDESVNHDVSHNDLPQSNEHITSSKLKKFIKANNNLKLVTSNLPKEIEIDDDDEIWLIRCPSEFVIDTTETNKIMLGTKSKLKTGSLTYDGYIVENNNNNAILSFKHGNIKISNNCVEKSIAFHKRIPKPHFVKDSQMVNNQTNFIPLPCTKTRHPLFGSNYKKAIKVPNLISDRLKTNEFNINKKIKKEKKKKINEIEKDESMEELSEVKQRKKKRKYSGVDEVDAVKKKRKIAPESSDAWDSEKAIAEKLFNF